MWRGTFSLFVTKSNLTWSEKRENLLENFWPPLMNVCFALHKWKSVRELETVERRQNCGWIIAKALKTRAQGRWTNKHRTRSVKHELSRNFVFLISATESNSARRILRVKEKARKVFQFTSRFAEVFHYKLVPLKLSKLIWLLSNKLRKVFEESFGKDLSGRVRGSFKKEMRTQK